MSKINLNEVARLSGIKVEEVYQKPLHQSLRDDVYNKLNNLMQEFIASNPLPPDLKRIGRSFMFTNYPECNITVEDGKVLIYVDWSTRTVGVDERKYRVTISNGIINNSTQITDSVRKYTQKFIDNNKEQIQSMSKAMMDIPLLSASASEPMPSEPKTVTKKLALNVMLSDVVEDDIEKFISIDDLIDIAKDNPRIKFKIGDWSVSISGKSDDLLDVKDNVEQTFSAAIEDVDHKKGNIWWSLY